MALFFRSRYTFCAYHLHTDFSTPNKDEDCAAQ
jgi:hypothetical protein